MKKLFVVFLLFGTLASSIWGETLKVGYFEHVPHFMVDKNGKAIGGTVEFFNKIAKEAGYETEWIGPLPVGRILVK